MSTSSSFSFLILILLYYLPFLMWPLHCSGQYPFPGGGDFSSSWCLFRSRKIHKHKTIQYYCTVYCTTVLRQTSKKAVRPKWKELYRRNLGLTVKQWGALSAAQKEVSTPPPHNA